MVVAEEPLEACLAELAHATVQATGVADSCSGIYLLRPRQKPLTVGTTGLATSLTAYRARSPRSRNPTGNTRPTPKPADRPTGRPAADGYEDRLAAISDTTGIQSTLVMTFTLFPDADMGVCLYSYAPGTFTEQTRATVHSVYQQTSRSLAIAVRLAQATENYANLVAAWNSRTTINTAAGIIMEQNKCSQQDAVGILQNAASNRNVKMIVLAQSIIARTQDGTRTDNWPILGSTR